MTGIQERVAGVKELVPSALLPSDPALYWQLTDEEETVIAHLTQAYKLTLSDHTYVKLTEGARAMTSHTTLSKVQQMTEDLVAFLRAVPDFAGLQVRDWMALLRANAIPLLLHRNALAAALDMEEMGKHLFADASEPRQGDDGEELVRGLCHLQRCLRPVVQDDLNRHVLLQLALILDPRAPGLWDRQAVNILQDKYMILIKHYLESQSSYLFCWHYVEEMLELVEESKVLGARLTQVFPAWAEVVKPLLDAAWTQQQPGR